MYVPNQTILIDVTDPGLQVSDHLRSAVDKARKARLLPPLSKLNSPTSTEPVPLANMNGTDELNLFTDLNVGAFALPHPDDPVFGNDFQWNQRWDFSLADQLFSTVTEPRTETGGHGLAFWERSSGA